MNAKRPRRRCYRCDQPIALSAMQSHLRGKLCAKIAVRKGIWCPKHLWNTRDNFCPGCIGAPPGSF